MIKVKETEKCLLRDVAVSNDDSLQSRTIERISEYVALQNECQMLNKSLEVVLVNIGAIGLIEKNLKKYLSRI